MQTAREIGQVHAKNDDVIVGAIGQVHSENGDVIAKNQRKPLARGITEDTGRRARAPFIKIGSRALVLLVQKCKKFRTSSI